MEGCLECACPRQDNTVCPSLGACPEECQQLVGGSGCPECVCDVPEPLCPPIDCPEECTVVEQDDSCPTCRCNLPRVCPAIPECLRGCIDQNEEGDCYLCNCTLASEQTPEPGSALPEADTPYTPDLMPSNPDVDDDLPSEPDPADTEALEPDRSDGEGRPPSDRRNSVPRCSNQRMECPAGCRMGIAAGGCPECYCGSDAMLCPGVQQCNSRCQFRSPADGCCRCQCPRRPAIPGLMITWKSFAPISSAQFFPFGPRRGWRGESSLVWGV